MLYVIEQREKNGGQMVDYLPGNVHGIVDALSELALLELITWNEFARSYHLTEAGQVILDAHTAAVAGASE